MYTRGEGKRETTKGKTMTANTTTINGTEYKVSVFGSIDITADYYIKYAEEVRTRRGILKQRAGWNVYHNEGSSPMSEHGEDQAAAEESARKLQVARDERAAAKKAEQVKADAAAAEREQLTATKGPLATPRQIDYIMTLLAQGRHHEGGFYVGPTTHTEIAKLSKAEASAYITSLKGTY